MLVELIKTIFGANLFINTAPFIPQAVRILRTKSTRGLSLMTFGGFCLIQLSTIAYGYVQHDYMLMLGFTLSLVTCGTVCILILFYRG